jgi:hypothetical protein
MLEVKKGFDTTLYQDLPPEQAKRRVRADAVAYVMETDINKPPEKRMTHLRYIPTEDGRDFSCSFYDEDEIILERTLEVFHNHPVSIEIFTRFLETDQRLLGLWISGPNPDNNEPEGRINVYIGRKKDKGIDYFPISIEQEDDWDEEKYLDTAQRFSQQEFEDISDLRETPLYMPINKDDDPIEILAEYIDMPSRVWQAITNGRSREEMVKVRRKATRVIDQHFDRLAAKVPYEEGIRRAARFERDLMRATGRTIFGFGSGCGASNNELLKINSFRLSVGSGQEASFQKEATGVYVKECPYCHYQINGYLKPGQECPNPDCHKVFRGVC